ncbi:MAG: hypothetical protein ACPLPR_05850, partial [Bacillota bacterium]
GCDCGIPTTRREGAEAAEGDDSRAGACGDLQRSKDTDRANETEENVGQAHIVTMAQTKKAA